MSTEKPVENPNLGRKKKHTMLMLLLLLLLSKEKKKQCRISVFLLCGRLYGMYLCITCGLHFAHCLSHEMKQFLVLKYY